MKRIFRELVMSIVNGAGMAIGAAVVEAVAGRVFPSVKKEGEEK